jgi:hypothetical protein
VDHPDDDGTVEWLAATVAIIPSLDFPSPPASLPVAVPIDVAPHVVAAALVSRPERSAHDPPWLAPSGLRGPPVFSA